ncbi:hypothetical protein LWP59_03195 [Amycolatopsis acidiphila]|uniref:Trp biosynthesis-associated membrane protein n=1 Tax=Amycolatopsis acidiphila TaxID=715473 RepID=A0A558A0Y9_9PSEU|nr:hypothetical protein [Amycolatopsis acidiphila]TVT17914.1 hypothetical protein FNH06_29755 [Amycolatopsis acidiphila]UIJ60705.1 hypothetical protein LWP59_03195 [Amycolatopsis acidiphila]GHG91322.1 hypothetical protein GCM10017788_67500 [Amycolatopsis acidiphila]
MTEGAVPAEDVPARRQSSWLVARLLGVLAAVVAAVLAIVGSFLSLVSGELTYLGRPVMTLAVTGWDLDAHAPAGEPTPVATPGGTAQNGIPLTIAGCLLVVAAIVGILAAPRFAPAWARSAAVLAGSVAAAFLTGTVVTVAAQVVNLSETIRPTGTAAGNAGYGAAAGPAAGFWLELVAALLAIAAAVLFALPPRRPAPEMTTPHNDFPPSPPQP